jgi:hypothetical protein
LQVNYEFVEGVGVIESKNPGLDDSIQGFKRVEREELVENDGTNGRRKIGRFGAMVVCDFFIFRSANGFSELGKCGGCIIPLLLLQF